MSFNRPNLTFEVRKKPRGSDKTAMEEFYQFISMTYSKDAVCIVYCMTKQDSEDAVNYLFDRGLSADFYRAGQSATDRHMVQEACQIGQLSIVGAKQKSIKIQLKETILDKDMINAFKQQPWLYVQV
ncbi:hypothetical protein KXD40_006646 [Peronospora effusa]|uniref:Uncharacterized protein n=1 Tax=Peronospora effusa TaxID=542832 RepID=A0A3M6V9R3_9STRA|nr:hypothetical protein DD238_007933 [Peronospora effusa]UIZ24751.1 hypothetical protein KXD40_006646 [Peronospora effusa]